MLGVSNNHVMKRSKRQSKKNKKEIKVTYISSPMKVKTSASNFRALVQELTGQYSNVAEMFVEVNDAAEDVLNYKGTSTQTQQWSGTSSTEADFPESMNWMKPDDDYSELLSRSSMEPLNRQLQFDFLSFDML